MYKIKNMWKCCQFRAAKGRSTFLFPKCSLYIFITWKKKIKCNAYAPIKYISHSRHLPPIVFQYKVSNYHIVKVRTRRNVNPTAVLFSIDKALVLRNKVKMEFFHATGDRASGWKALESFLESSM